MLRSIPVVNIHVDDQNFFNSSMLLECSGCDRYGIEETEAHRLARFGVVTRRTKGRKSRIEFAGGHLYGQIHAASGCEPGHIETRGRNERVGVQTSVASFCCRLDVAQVFGGVDEQNIVVGRHARGECSKRVGGQCAPVRKRLADGDEPRGRFGVMGRFDVILKPRILDHANSSGDVHGDGWYLTDVGRSSCGHLAPTTLLERLS